MVYTFKHGDRPLSDITVQRGVGRGGFGEVYYALTDGGREVALKYLRDNPEVELRGVAACMNLKCPHLVSIHDVRRSAEGEYFVIMEYIAGPTLRDMLVASPRGLGTERAAYILREVAAGLAYLHDRGIVHRDLKPGNIFYEDGMVKIGDYGLSKYLSVSRHSAQTSSVGTVHYMAPEVGTGSYTRSIDIYALGVIFYEMLLGKVPFEGGSMGEVLMKHLTAQPEVDALPAPFGQVIRTALAKDPQQRYQQVEDMVTPVLAATGIRNSLAGFDHSVLGTFRPAATIDANPAPAMAAAVAAPPRPPQPGPAVRRLPNDRPRPAMSSPPPAPRPNAPAPAAAVIGFDAHALSPEAAAGRIVFAGFWIRALAAVIDMVIVGVAINILTQGGGLLGGIAYEGLLVGLWNGQTLGKRACGIKVICEDGRVCGLGRAFVRSVADILGVVTLGIGFIMAAFDREKRALHDHVVATRVIYALESG